MHCRGLLRGHPPFSNPYGISPLTRWQVPLLVQLKRQQMEASEAERRERRKKKKQRARRRYSQAQQRRQVEEEAEEEAEEEEEEEGEVRDEEVEEGKSDGEQEEVVVEENPKDEMGRDAQPGMAIEAGIVEGGDGHGKARVKRKGEGEAESSGGSEGGGGGDGVRGNEADAPEADREGEGGRKGGGEDAEAGAEPPARGSDGRGDETAETGHSLARKSPVVAGVPAGESGCDLPLSPVPCDGSGSPHARAGAAAGIHVGAGGSEEAEEGHGGDTDVQRDAGSDGNINELREACAEEGVERLAGAVLIDLSDDDGDGAAPSPGVKRRKVVTSKEEGAGSGGLQQAAGRELLEREREASSRAFPFSHGSQERASEAGQSADRGDGEGGTRFQAVTESANQEECHTPLLPPGEATAAASEAEQAMVAVGWGLESVGVRVEGGSSEWAGPEREREWSGLERDLLVKAVMVFGADSCSVAGTLLRNLRSCAEVAHALLALKLVDASDSAHWQVSCAPSGVAA